MNPPSKKITRLVDQAQCRLSIVIPAYNESKRLGQTLRQLRKQLPELHPLQVTKVIVIDDGSTDRTVDVAYANGRKLPDFEVVSSGENRGKGDAIRCGLKLCRDGWALVADADMATPWMEVKKLWDQCRKQNASIAIASRALQESQLKRKEIFPRQVLGKSFNLFVRIVLGLPFKDTQCGFKLIEMRLVRPLLSSLHTSRFAIDVELLVLAAHRGLKIIEVPTVWFHHKGSKVRVLRDGIKMLWDVLQIRLRLRRLVSASGLPTPAHDRKMGSST